MQLMMTLNDRLRYVVDTTVEVKLDSYPPGRRGMYVLFRTYCYRYNHLEWSLLLEILNGIQALGRLLEADDWQVFSCGDSCKEFAEKYPRLMTVIAWTYYW